MRWCSSCRLLPAAAVLAAVVVLSGCSSGHRATLPPSSSTTSTSSSTTSSSSTSSTSTPPAGAHTVALGTNNPVQGDCTTDTSEAATSVGSVVITVTATTFQADIELQSGSPSTSYGVFMQQVPGSCPQQMANGGSLATDATGRAQAQTSVTRVAGATTFFVQLVPAGSQGPDYTSDRISIGS